MSRSVWCAAVLAGAVAVGCTHDHIIYRNTNFAAPPSNAGGFLGYATVSTQMTVCGDCHVDHQTTWIRTAHAHAWRDLIATGENPQFCQQCHAVSQNGNGASSAQVGYVSTKDTRYQDVQCENCHGPGLTHVTSPSIANHPLASLRADTSSTTGCGACHTGVHEPFVNEWVTSRHATVPAWQRAHPEANTQCQGCHTGQGALVAWGVNTNYKEAGFANGDTLPITCTVCHDPHSNANQGQLRFPINVADVSVNLCMKCHQNGSTLSAETKQYGPHSPEGPLLLGTAGWFPPNLQVPGGIDTIVSTHGSSANPRLCAQCHVDSLTISDTSGKFVYHTTGHSFNAIPCVDAQGLPTGTDNCVLATRSFAGCTASGCHGTQSVAMSAYQTGVGRILQLDTVLRKQLATVLAATPAETASTNATYTVAAGSLFNAQLAELPGSPIHNPFLMEALLTGSISAMTNTYGVPSTQRVSLALKLKHPSDVRLPH